MIEWNKLKKLANEVLQSIPLAFRGRYVNLITEGDEIMKLAAEAKYSLLHYKHMDNDVKHVEYAIQQLESIFNKEVR